MLNNGRVKSSAELQEKRAAIKQRLIAKKAVRLEPEILKNYNEKFETESKRLLDDKLAAGKRKRLKKRQHYIKKKMFGKYIDQTQGNKKSMEPNFELDAISKQVKFIEMDIEKEKAKFIKKNTSGVSSVKADQTALKEIGHVAKIMKHPSFKSDPLETIK